jgi:hypothetical protein
MMHCTMGSERARRLRPSTSLGRSEATLGSTATRTTGLTLNFMACRGKKLGVKFECNVLYAAVYRK